MPKQYNSIMLVGTYDYHTFVSLTVKLFNIVQLIWGKWDFTSFFKSDQNNTVRPT